MIKYAALTLLCALVVSCVEKKKERQVQQQEPPTPQNEANTAFEDQFIDGLPIQRYLKMPEFPKVVEDYYYNKIKIQSNQQTDSLLSILITPDEDLTPFYFKCFMNICQEADTTLSTYLGEYCVLLLEKNTNYCINKLKKGYPDYFTGLIANEIYQKENWEEEINNLSVRLHVNLENDAPELRKELDLLIVGIKNDIEHMM